MWNVWWIGVAPERHGAGVGAALLAHVERRATDRGGRVLVIETSDGPATARARTFYRRAGYDECGRVPDFYASDEAKVIFAKRLRQRA